MSPILQMGRLRHRVVTALRGKARIQRPYSPEPLCSHSIRHHPGHNAGVWGLAGPVPWLLEVLALGREALLWMVLQAGQGQLGLGTVFSTESG